MMRASFLILILLFKLFATEDPKLLMDSISQHAIHLGEGADRTYVFVDPLCPMSRAYLSVITEREDLQKKTSFYIFLYQLPMFDSAQTIEYIYQSKQRRDTLFKIMLEGEIIDLESFESTMETREIIDDIADVGQELNIRRRPYLLMYKKGSPYCQVSDGTAPCLEDKDLYE